MKIKRHLWFFLIALVTSVTMSTCGGEKAPAGEISAISTDPNMIRLGKEVFDQDCSACHNFKQDGIGPNLAGVTGHTSVQWLHAFIRSPKAQIENGDEWALELYEKYKTSMPSFEMYSDETIDNIITYLHTYENLEVLSTEDSMSLTDPIKELVSPSNLVVVIEYFSQIPASSENKPLTRIVKMDHIPGSKRLFVADLRGKLYELRGSEPMEVLDMADIFPDFIPKPGLGTGFGSFAFHPDFLKKGLLYVTHTEPPATREADFSYADSLKVTVQWVVSEFQVKDPSADKFEGVMRDLFSIDMTSAVHGIQEISFNPFADPGSVDYGNLYINIGDGGAVLSGYPTLADNATTAWGAVLRISPEGRNSDNGSYGIPDDNPYAGDRKNLGEVYAFGFRNPNRQAWDRHGRLLVTGIGQSSIEEVNIIESGRNYGWPYREGTFVLNPYGDISNVYPLPAQDEREYTYPVLQFDHSDGRAISGGFEYVKSDIPELMGKYLFGDIALGRLFYVEVDDLKIGHQANIYEWKISIEGQITDLATLCGGNRVELRFGKDADDTFYLFTKADGKIYKVVGVVPTT